jgi:hypothetical protein
MGGIHTEDHYLKGHVTLLGAAIFGLNAFLCWPLFHLEYLDAFQSNEGSFISIARFLREYWPHVAWFPWFNGGTPLESAYFPLVPALVAVTASLARCTPPHAFHFLAALAYSLGPVFLFLFAHKVSGTVAPSLAAAVLWSLFSPASVVPQTLGDTGTLWGLHRLKTIVFYGETPHNIALSLIPLAWLLLARYWESPRPRRFAAAVIVCAAIMLSNALGLAVVASSVLLLWLSIDGRTWRQLASTGAVLLFAYLLICRSLHPSLLWEVAVNSQTLGRDYRHVAWAVLLLPVLAALWLALRRVSSAMVRFAALFTAYFGGIVALWYWKGVGLPQAHRYTLEAEAGFCLLAAFGLYPLWRRLPAKTAGLISIALLGLVVRADYRSARHWIREADITQSAVYREATWIGENLPGRRVMASGDTEFWFNLFADNPQMAAGHEAAANWVQRVALYQIYTGQGAGAQDGPISVLWLKAFGCGAITVPGPGSRDYFHPMVQPGKFAGLLPLVWREGDDFIYEVPQGSASLAHVVPIHALVDSRPVNGLDVGLLRGYVEALEDPTLPSAHLEWKNPEQGRITAEMDQGQAISVQVTYDRGWRASVGGHPVIVHSDGLGMIAIEPGCVGECTIDLQFSGGTERHICLALGILAALALLARALA